VNYSFHHEAEAEFELAVEFYEECEPGLGEAFSEEIIAAIERILRFPESWPKYTHRSRRCLCNRFPFSLVYRVQKNEIMIYAVMHQKRKPGYWKD
jgi:plasmid stabilization system protein ParE